MFPGYRDLVERLDVSVDAGSSEAITARVKANLEDLLGRGVVLLPERLRSARSETYARRLLHKDPAGRYTAIVMTWGPGQGTPVHDHGGLWCVEGVVEGQIAVTQYQVAPDSDGLFRLAQGDTMLAGTGSAGRLIPPTDYHVLSNALPDKPSVTLHVYGGDLSRCKVFLPDLSGRFAESVRELTYHD